MPSKNELLNSKKVFEKLILNVSGQKFECFRSTLEKYPDTLLGSMEREYFYDEDAEEYYFERDPDFFRYILNFYRTGHLHFPKAECLASFSEELSFFGIKESLMSVCCREEYKNKSETNILKGYEPPKSQNQAQPPISLKEKIYLSMEDPEKSTLALVFFYVTGFFIVVSVLANIFETLNAGNDSKKQQKTITLGEKYKDFFLH